MAYFESAEHILMLNQMAMWHQATPPQDLLRAWWVHGRPIEIQLNMRIIYSSSIRRSAACSSEISPKVGEPSDRQLLRLYPNVSHRFGTQMDTI